MVLFCCLINTGLKSRLIADYIYNPSKPPFDKGGLWQGVALLASGEMGRDGD